MKVGELIALLQREPADAEVFIYEHPGNDECLGSERDPYPSRDDIEEFRDASDTATRVLRVSL